MTDPAVRTTRSGRRSIPLSVKFAVLYAVLSAAVFFVAFELTNSELEEWVEEQMEARAVVLKDTFAKGGLDALTETISVLGAVDAGNERIYQLIEANGQHLSGDQTSISPKTDVEFVPVGDIQLEIEPEDEISGYWIRIDPIGPYFLIQGVSDHSVSEVLEGLSTALVLGYFVVLFLGVFLGRRMAKTTDRRIAVISRTLTAASEGALDLRVPVSGSGNDDLSRVSNSINDALDQLERLLESQRQISADIAHDLRTPLQRLRQRLERMIDQKADKADLNAALYETEGIIETFQALLSIARIEAAESRVRFEGVNLQEIAGKVVDAFEPVADDKGQTLTTALSDATDTVQGDPALLTQMLSNLVENAIRHCPEGSTIHVRLSQEINGPVLTVSDDGPGISQEHAGKVFRRFYRVDKSRASDGHGLGMTLVKAICDLHKAAVSLPNTPSGLMVRVAFDQT